MERIGLKRSLAAMAVLAGSFMLSGCGSSSDESEPSNQASISVTDFGSSEDGAENIKFVSLGTINRSGFGDDVEIYHGQYDFEGNHYDCTLAVSDGGKSGGTGIDCEVTPIQEELGGKQVANGSLVELEQVVIDEDWVSGLHVFQSDIYCYNLGSPAETIACEIDFSKLGGITLSILGGEVFTSEELEAVIEFDYRDYIIDLSIGADSVLTSSTNIMLGLINKYGVSDNTKDLIYNRTRKHGNELWALPEAGLIKL